MSGSDGVVSVPVAEWEAMKAALAALEPMQARLAELERAAGTGLDAGTGERQRGEPAPEVGAADVVEEPGGGGAHRRSRRDLLRGAGVAAAGAVVGGATLAMAQADPAAATSGSSLIAGQANTATNPTAIAVSGVTGSNVYGFGVTDVTLGAFPHSGAIAGHTAGNYNAGVLGYDNSSIGQAGVVGYSEGGVGVWANCNQGLAAYFSGAVAARFLPDSTPPPSRVDLHQAGELHPDGSNDLWFCVAPGHPGTWRKLAGIGTAGQLHVLAAPTRCYDSRPGLPNGGGTKGVLPGATQRTIDTKNNGTGVPAGATAVLVNLTVTNTSPGGFLSLYSNALAAWPGTSNVNWDRAGQTIANSAVVAVDATAQLKAYANSATDFLIDVVGYYR